jgi:transporter family-2 protein
MYTFDSKTLKMKSDFLFLALALITGALIPVQAATNAAFSKSIGNPMLTGLMVFTVGLTGMLLFILFSKTAFPGREQLAAAPVYSYFGGIIVAVYVVMITILVPRIGVGTAIAFIVTGQVICAVAIDHFGLFNVAIRSLSITRIAGVGLMIAGIYFVMKK